MRRTHAVEVGVGGNDPSEVEGLEDERFAVGMSDVAPASVIVRRSRILPMGMGQGPSRYSLVVGLPPTLHEVAKIPANAVSRCDTTYLREEHLLI